MVNDALAHSRELCLLHANCQGEPLALLLAACPEFSRRWRIVQYTNYTKDAIPEDALRTATLFLYQHLGPEWMELASESLLARLSPAAASVSIPNMFFKGYWPFWRGEGPIAFSDALLDKLIDAGAAKPEILRVYLHGSLPKTVDMAASLAETLTLERAKERWCFIPVVDFVERHWRDRMLFHTVNHPGRELLVYAANSILACLGLPPVPEAFAASFVPEYADFDLPIHPAVAAFHGLAFAGEDQEYEVFGRRMTFARYISRYIDCRVNKLEDDFLGYLQVV